jgi:phosphate transport system protein
MCAEVGMSRVLLDRELQRIQDNVLSLGSMVEESLGKSVTILRRRDCAAAERLINEDRLSDAKKASIARDVLKVIVTQQPVAGDMRVLAAILEISTELERIGNYAKGIARISLLMGAERLLSPLPDLNAMAQRTQSMLHGALEALIWKDIGLAQAVPLQDKAVDALYERVRQELLASIACSPTREIIEQANHLLSAAHNLERAADRVTNICERVVYALTGEMVEMDASAPALEWEERDDRSPPWDTPVDEEELA